MGVLTGGGDCPGLNAVIRAVGRRTLDRGHEYIGIRGGWKGLIDGELSPLGYREIGGILPRGGRSSERLERTLTRSRVESNGSWRW